ncbi:uncharacterized protein LOC141693307 isoform X1 [Apium graveolens]|uniref:uncharacterized protein LOC141693307 isoform X1 n=1 Tax=Apium graveolens TaxID=4045 RepID=UPI003D7B2042
MNSTLFLRRRIQLLSETTVTQPIPEDLVEKTDAWSKKKDVDIQEEKQNSTFNLFRKDDTAIMIQTTLRSFLVRICKEKSIGHVYAMKKLKKSEMLRRGQEDQERVKLLMDIEELSIQKPNNGGASRARNASPSCFCRS